MQIFTIMLSVKHTNAIARTIACATSHRCFKHTILSFGQHTSATTCAMGNAIIFKTVTFSSRLIYCIGRCVGSHVVVWTATRLLRLSPRPTSGASLCWCGLRFMSNVGSISMMMTQQQANIGLEHFAFVG